MKLILLRHGRTSGNTEKRYIGQKTDEPVLPEENDRIDCLTTGLLRVIPENFKVYSSPLLRCRMTAERLLGIMPVTCPGLSEIDFGLFEGKTWRELSDDAELGVLYRTWVDSGGTLAFPAGESRENFSRRSRRSFLKIMAESKECSDTDMIVIVCHGGTIMSIMSQLTGRDYYDFMADNLDGYYAELEVNGENTHVLSYCRLGDRIHS